MLVVGHLIERKDPLLALATLRGARARARGVPLARSSARRSSRERLAGAIAAAGLAARVRLPAERAPDELARWYAAADVLLLTSRREGRPNVVLEALACGRPVLATAAGGTAELLEGLDGMLARDARARGPGARARRAAAPRARPEERLRRPARRASPGTRGWTRSRRCLQASRVAGMKILYHHRTQAEDGQAVHIRALQRAFAAEGHEVHEVSPRARARRRAPAPRAARAGVP